MSKRYRYFLAFNVLTEGPPGETILRNDVILWPKLLVNGDDIKALEMYLNARDLNRTYHVILNFILLEIVEEKEVTP